MPITFNISNLKFKNSYTLYEQTIKCVIKDYEFNASYNPTLSEGSPGYIFQSGSQYITGSNLPELYTGSYYVYPDPTLKEFTTAPSFNPYVTTVGLYNDSNQLLAIAKLAQPLPLSSKTDTTILVKIDW
jgi:hypothetical protein